MSTGCDAKVTVKREALVKALRIIQRNCKVPVGEEAILAFDEANLHITLGGLTVAVPAIGAWPGQARVVGKFLIAIATLPPVEDPVTFKVADGFLHLGSSSIHCAWQSAWSAEINLPMNVSLLQLLALRHTYTNEQIMQSGLSINVKSAEVKRDRMITKAFKILCTMDITEADLRLLIEQKVKAHPAAQSI